MSELILTEEQAKIVSASLLNPVTVRDPQGHVIGRIEPELTPEIVAELKRRAAAPGPRYTGRQVQARLQALQAEWDRLGGFNEAYMREFLSKLNAADPGHMR